MQQRNGRWYDRYPPLDTQFEALKEMSSSQRNKIMRELRKLITDDQPTLIDRTVMDYPLTYKRRWYDKDPLCWLTINALKHGGEPLINEAIAFLKDALK